MNERDVALNKVKNARYNLLVMIIFTLVNLVLLMLDSTTFLLFSATVPYYAVAFNMIFVNGTLPVVGLVIAAICLLAYFLCWLFSKKNTSWMLVALILFIIDTICLILLYVLAGDFSGILDFVIHVMVIYYLITGVKYGSKLKKMPEAVETHSAEEMM